MRLIVSWNVRKNFSEFNYDEEIEMFWGGQNFRMKFKKSENFQNKIWREILYSKIGTDLKVANLFTFKI